MFGGLSPDWFLLSHLISIEENQSKPTSSFKTHLETPGQSFLVVFEADERGHIRSCGKLLTMECIVCCINCKLMSLKSRAINDPTS